MKHHLDLSYVFLLGLAILLLSGVSLQNIIVKRSAMSRSDWLNDSSVRITLVGIGLAIMMYLAVIGQYASAL